MARRLDPDDRRSELMQFGRKHFAEMAFDAMSIDDIASAAGVSKGTIYNYFGSRRGFYIATVEDVVHELMRVLSRPQFRQDPTNARPMVAAFVDYVDDHGGIYLAVVRGGLGADRELASLLDLVRRTACEAVFAMYKIEAPSELLRLSVIGWVASVEFTTAYWLGDRQVTREELIALLVRSLATAVKEEG